VIARMLQGPGERRREPSPWMPSAIVSVALVVAFVVVLKAWISRPKRR
jgi:hypothetical protein